MNRGDVVVDPVLEALEASLEGPSVVAIGGGHGLAQTLDAVQRYAGDITAVVGVSDDGGSSGRLAPAFGIPPPGDLRRALLALSPSQSAWRSLFEYRFEEGDVAGHSLGNLILAAFADLDGDFELALRTAEMYLAASGRVVPAATRALVLEAVDRDGDVVRGQLAIAQSRRGVDALRLLPADAAVNPVAVDAVAGADQVILGPGSLFTSTLAALLVPGLADAVNRAACQVVYVCNLVTQDGETLGMSAEDHVTTLTAMAGLERLDAIVASTSSVAVPPPHEPVMVSAGAFQDLGVDVVRRPLALADASWPVHDPVALGEVLGMLAGH